MRINFTNIRFVVVVILVPFISFHSYSQEQLKLPTRAIQIAAGYSKHGSGDFHGIVFGAEYIRYFTPSISVNYNFRGSINHGKEFIIVNNNITGTRTDASVRFTTAGVQLGANGRYSILRNLDQEFAASLGAFVRYQSASNGSDGYSIYYPQTTGQPTVLIGYDNRTPQNTVSVGGIFQLEYSYRLPFNYYVGVLPGFQTDTNGDAIFQVALAVGRRF